jgi:hypothetical protein
MKEKMKNTRETRFTFGLILVILIGLSAGTQSPAFAQVIVPNTFSAGTAISSSQVNQNFQALSDAMPRMKAAIGNSVTLSDVYQNIASLTVTAPADGSVILLGNALVTMTQGTQAGGGSWSTSTATLCLTQTSNGGPPGNCVPLMLDTVPLANGAPAQPYAPRLTVPATIVGSGPISKNTPVTFYLTGGKDLGSVGSSSVSGGSLTAIFIPNGL